MNPEYRPTGSGGSYGTGTAVQAPPKPEVTAHDVYVAGLKKLKQLIELPNPPADEVEAVTKAVDVMRSFL